MRVRRVVPNSRISTVFDDGSTIQYSEIPERSYSVSFGPRSWDCVEGERTSITRSGAPWMLSSVKIWDRFSETNVTSGSTMSCAERRTSVGATKTWPSLRDSTKSAKSRKSLPTIFWCPRFGAGVMNSSPPDDLVPEAVGRDLLVVGISQLSDGRRHTLIVSVSDGHVKAVPRRPERSFGM